MRGFRPLEFHLVHEGRGYIRVGEETTPLVAGDIVLLPHGDSHYKGNGVSGEAIDGEEALPTLLAGQLELARLGGGGEPTRLICGYLACDARLIQPALARLPRVVRVHIRSDAAGAWLESSIRHAVNQAATAPPGGDVVLAWLAEVLFAETLRRYLLQLPPEQTGWLAGAGDPRVGRSLAILHRRALSMRGRSISLRRKRESRDPGFTERFARYLGQSPMAYLADWRLELAAESLRSTSRSVLAIASDVGYDSESAFNRATRRSASTVMAASAEPSRATGRRSA